MATSYFGNNVDGTNYASLGTKAYINYMKLYTCPGDGDQDLAELGVRTHSVAALGNVRVAIYSSDATALVAQGAVQLASGADAWRTHTTFTNAAGVAVHPVLTGGTQYRLVATGDGAPETWLTIEDSSKYVSQDYTGGFPADGTSILEGDLSSAVFCVRAGVTPHIPRRSGMGRARFLLGLLMAVVDWVRRLFGIFCFT